MTNSPWPPALQERKRDKHRIPVELFLYLEYYKESEQHKLPHIEMDPNPGSFSISSKMVETKTQMMAGFYEEVWGESVGTISAQGTTRGFFIPDYGYVGDDQRFDSTAYEKYRVLLEVFKNNGAVYDNQGRVVLQGAVNLRYDNITYEGRFNSFRTSWDKPFMYDLNFTFEFNRRYR